MLVVESERFLVSSTSDTTGGSSVSNAVLVRPDSVEGVTSRITTGHGKLFMTLNSNNGVPFEVFFSNWKIWSMRFSIFRSYFTACFVMFEK